MMQRPDCLVWVRGGLRCVALGMILLPACSKEESSTPASQPAVVRKIAGDSLETLILKDVQALRGGRILYLRGDGRAVCRIVERRPPQTDLFERRFVFAVKPETVTALTETIRDHDFFGITVPERAGLPDESRPSITVTLQSGKSKTVVKWRSIENKGFDALYQTCLEIGGSGTQGRADYDGRYEPGWSPSGFRAP